jgi:methionyl-tRNA formyltransferase
MRIVFMGTPEFAVPSLEACVETGNEVALVVTQPARARGRGQRIVASPIRQRAEALGLPVLETEKVNQEQDLARLRETDPGLVCVAAFGQLLSADVLAVPSGGCVNVHGSLLPRWRGAAPIHHALMAGDAVTGVTTMSMVQKMDAGDILLQRSTPIGPSETQGDLSRRLARMGGELLAETLGLLERGAAPRTAQDPAAVTFAPLLKKEDGRVDWTQPAERIRNLVRGTIPWPGAFCFTDGGRLRLWETRTASVPSAAKGEPGEVVEICTDGIVVASGEGLIVLTEVQPENKRRMPATDWSRGARIRCGDVLH